MQKLQTISDLTKISPVGLDYLHKTMEKISSDFELSTMVNLVSLSKMSLTENRA